MPTNATVMESVDEGVQELKDRVVRLTAQLEDVQKQKKAANDGFNAEIKDLREMIKMTIEQIKVKEAESDEPTLLS